MVGEAGPQAFAQRIVEIVAAHRSPERRDRVVEDLLASVELRPRRDVRLVVREVAVPPAQRGRDEAQAALLVAQVEVSKKGDLKLGWLVLLAEKVTLLRPATQDAPDEL